jgi:PAS domain S-box-containing protein
MKTNHSSESKFSEQTKFMVNLIKHVSQPMIVTSAERQLLYWNAAFSKLTGYSNKELGDPIIGAGLTAPEWHDNETKALEKLQHTGKSQIFQKEYIRKDGSRVPVEVLIYQYMQGNGESPYYIGLITDITERKKLEEALQKSESHYRVLVENAIEGIAVIQEGQIKFVNPLVAAATGYSVEEMTSMPLDDLLWPDNEKASVESISKAAVPGSVIVVPLLRIRTKGGETRLIESTVVPIIWDEKPANLNLLRDMTERKTLESHLENEREEFKTILDSAPIIIFYKDRDGRFVRVNRAFSEALELPEEEFWGKTVFDLYSTEIAKSMTKDDREVLTSRRPKLNIIEQYESASGIRWVRTDKVPTFDKDGSPIGLVGFAQDVTERKQAEELLSQSEKRYRSILEDIREGYWEVDLAGNFSSFNDAVHRLLGYSKKDMIGMNYRDYTGAADVEKVYKAFNQVYRTGKPIRNMHYEIVRKDGSKRFAETSVFPKRNDKEEIIGFRGVSHDITERKNIEETLRRSEERYRTILEEIRDAYFEVDLVGNFTFGNDSFYRYLGYSADELIGMNYRACTAPEDIKKVYQGFNQVYRGIPVNNLTYKSLRKDGSSGYVEIAVTLIRNKEGNIIGFRGVGRDVSERMRMEEALRQSEGKYRSILEDMEEAYSEVDLAGNFTFFNDALCKHLGYFREELMGMNYKVYTAPEIVKNVFQAYNQVYKTGKPIELFAIEEIRKDGTKMVAEISVAPVKNDRGEVTGFRQLSRDMTERIRIQEALRQSEEKYRTIMEDIEEAYYELDLEGNFTFINDATGRQLGYSTEELLGMNYRTYTAPEDVKRVLKAYNGVYRTGKPVTSFSHREIRKDGRQIIAETSILPLRNENGDIIGFRGVGRDVTERLQIEEALRQSEEKYRSILETMEETYYEVDLAGNFTFFNETLRKSFGYTKEELMGMSYKVYTPPEIVDKVFQAYNQVYRTGELIIGFPMEQIRKDGTRLVIENSIMPIRNEEGEITGFRGIGRDVTERLRMEEALRQSEEKYRTILQEMEESYYEEDLAGNFTFVNNTLCRDLGYTKEELIGMNYRNYIPPEELQRVRESYTQVYRTGKPIELFSTQQIRKDGNRIFSEISIAPLRNHKDEIIGFRGVGRDISKRVQMEESLRKSEARYRTILEDMQESYFEVDLRGNYTLFNDAQCRQLGYTREEMIGLNYKKITPSDRQKEVFEIYNRIYRTGEPNELFQAEQIRKDGKRIPVEYSAYPIRNEQGEIIGFRGVGRDIAKRMQMEEALRRSEERYRTVLEDMEEAYYEEDQAGNFIFFNDALCRQLGYSPEELMGMNYKTYTAPEDIDSAFKAFNTIYRTGEPLTGFQMTRITKDGKRVFTETSGFPLRDETGKIIGFRGVIRDMTERKKAEEERKQLEQKAQLASRLASVGELASGVAHEINNPLTGVIGYAHLLLTRKDLSRDVRHDLEIINEGAQRVAGIVKKLLAFARQTKPEQRYVNINELIRNTLELRAYELAASNIKVTLQLTRDIPMTIADPGQLQQVFLNLIINAETEMKVAHDKGRLSIKTERMNRTIRITFKDNGPGIPEENLETIFDPFFTTREVGQGTGLGLSVCHGIVTEHKGRIWAESEPGKGATFIIELPLTTEEEQLELPEPEIEELKKVTKAKILVVDDEPVIRQFISQVLSEQGHTVETADSAAGALKMVKAKRYRLILLDIKMPGISGVELYKQFQKIAPSLTKRVAFITGDVMGKRTIAFLNKTKAPYLMKPFDARELKTAINRILAKK